MLSKFEQPQPVGEAMQEKVASVTVQFQWADRQTATRREETLKRIAEQLEKLVREDYSDHELSELYGYEEVGALVKNDSILTLRTVVTPNLEDVGRVAVRSSLSQEDLDQIAEDKAIARAEEVDTDEEE